jgi:hypothetical protein
MQWQQWKMGNVLVERSELQSNLLHLQNIGASRPIGTALLGPKTHNADTPCGILISVRLAWDLLTYPRQLQQSRRRCLLTALPSPCLPHWFALGGDRGYRSEGFRITPRLAQGNCHAAETK